MLRESGETPGASLTEKFAVDGHGCLRARNFVSGLKKVLRYTCYLTSIKTYKARFIANSSSCMTTELSKS